MKFKKLIVTPGTHNVGRVDGTSEVVPITKDRIATWVKNTNRLKALGVKIPAPFAHQDANKNFPLPVILGTDGATLADAYQGYSGLSWDAAANGGFWEDDFAIDPATGGLEGHVEAPGEATDHTSPAGKVSTTVKETSVFVMGPRKVVVNGVEHEVGEHLAHVAMCLHPAQPGQRNFEPVKGPLTPDLKLAMSFCMADAVGAPQTPAPAGATSAVTNGLPDPTKAVDAELSNLLAMLRNVTYIDLPDTTTRESIVTDLSLALRQKSADQQEAQKKEDSLTQRPEGTDTKSPSIAMTNLIPQATATKTGEPAPAAPTSADMLLAMTMSNLIVGKKKGLKERVDRLCATGRCKKPYADAKLYPRIEALLMSPAQLQEAKGDISNIRDSVEDLIEGLEQAQPLAGGSVVDDENASWDRPDGTTVESHPDPAGPDADLSQAESDAICDAAVNMAGM